MKDNDQGVVPSAIRDLAKLNSEIVASVISTSNLNLTTYSLAKDGHKNAIVLFFVVILFAGFF